MFNWDIQFKEESNLPVWERILSVRSLSDEDLQDKDFYNPYLMKDIHKAVKLLTNSIAKNLRIVIWGDYDAKH